MMRKNNRISDGESVDSPVDIKIKNNDRRRVKSEGKQREMTAKEIRKANWEKLYSVKPKSVKTLVKRCI
jgi:hypothetical protein